MVEVIGRHERCWVGSVRVVKSDAGGSSWLLEALLTSGKGYSSSHVNANVTVDSSIASSSAIAPPAFGTVVSLSIASTVSANC